MVAAWLLKQRVEMEMNDDKMGSLADAPSADADITKAELRSPTMQPTPKELSSALSEAQKLSALPLSLGRLTSALEIAGGPGCSIPLTCACFLPTLDYWWSRRTTFFSCWFSVK